MANELFENPKVALGFAGVVVAIALVASVAFKEFSPSEEDVLGTSAQEQTTTGPAPSQAAAPPANASNAAPAWGEASASGDGWGAPVSSAQNGGFAEVPEQTNDMPVFSDHVSKSIADRRPAGPGSPIITTSVAPGAPTVSPPETGPQPTIVAEGG